VFRVGEVYLPSGNMLTECERVLTGDAGTLLVGGGGGGGGDVAFAFLPRRKTGSPSSSELKSETDCCASVSVIMS
jgi:hypothetical protein